MSSVRRLASDHADDTPSTLLNGLAAAGVIARVAAAGALIFGPWTNEASELSGWDIERFWEIAGINGRHWVDDPVEYPPGSVALIELLVGSSLVAAHRLIVALSLVVDLGLAAVLDRWVNRKAAAAYLVLGLPLVPGGLLRFDLWVALFATAALLTLPWRKPGRFGLLVAVGAAIKIIPVVLIPLALATRRFRSAAAAAALGVAAVVGWVAYGSTDAIGQVLSLRDATGWHVESLPGALIALFGTETSRLEADAFRIGTLSTALLTVGRLIFLGIVAVLVWARHRTRNSTTLDAVTVLGMLAGLVVTAPLLSPQFLLWLTPFAAIVAANLGWRHPVAVVTMSAIVITGITLAIFGPPNLHNTEPAALLTIRNLLLVALVPLTFLELRRAHAVAADDDVSRYEA